MSDVEKAVNILNHEISRLSGIMSENELKIKRLWKAKSNIENDQEELIHHQKKVYKPEFSSNTWAGRHASKHLNILDRINRSYKQIANNQVEDVIDAIESKIKQLESENHHLMSSVISKRRELSGLRN
ncbi:DUF5082 domain-containing protein [Heyndrickxia sporothermodurans]|uniref:DUF5082 family protein n=1 Tax=Heyndrickxia sporothermodurans TaxID=46224 RepID=A0A150LCB3_9BACI|nr:DUF5082 family protein [Heyndrickxia sporothermodurans]KYD09987.1 hypothetical protein B4102_2400 [Heyndrickxia sporothermodurans]MBL5766990.1 DUF5082 family protein [Heyndrickxia sporothermodurans]MBL5770458.1 DUF5082 family protein [Heyndrickxia sporothermodurans]MBL5774147.1 DUF5082 family protein [Heyndrickxia sporothermodurans]MBL5778309.1 DUF5082 family protein [Heyndrickxia sporothermodurans]